MQHLGDVQPKSCLVISTAILASTLLNEPTPDMITAAFLVAKKDYEVHKKEFPEAMLNKVNEVMAPASVEQTQKSTSALSSDGDVSTVAETEEGNRKLKKLKKAT